MPDTRVLIVRLSSIGDVLHATPVAKALKKNRPDWHVTWLAGKTAAPLLSANPYIDELVVWPREDFEKAVRSRQFGLALKIWRYLIGYFNHHRFDITLDVHGLFITGLITYLSKSKRRIGLSGTKELNHLFMTEVAPPAANPHVIYRYLSVLRPLNIAGSDHTMTLYLDLPAVTYAADLFKCYGIKDNDTVMVLNPATTWPSKNWPPKYFAEAASRLRHHGHILLCGGPDDVNLAGEIIRQASVPIINIAGRTTLMQLAALIARADLVITGDTGPLHMAVALNTPTVSIFGPTDPRRFGPLNDNHIVLTSGACTPCHKTGCKKQDLRCLTAVTPSAVAAAAAELLNCRTKLNTKSWHHLANHKPNRLSAIDFKADKPI